MNSKEFFKDFPDPMPDYKDERIRNLYWKHNCKVLDDLKEEHGIDWLEENKQKLYKGFEIFCWSGLL